MASSSTRGFEASGRGAGAAAAALTLAGMLMAGTAAAQVYVVTPDAAEREASAATTIMLNPFYLARTFDPADVHAVEMADGSLRLSHPELGMNFFSARVRPDGSLATGCETMTDYQRSEKEYAPDAADVGAEVAR